MFQTIQPREIFDPACWQVSEDYPPYWLAQMRKQDWIRLLLLLSLKPARRANKPVLAGLALERLEFKVCESWLEALQTWQAQPGAIIIQFRHSDTDWTRGIPEILPPDKGDRLGIVNIAGRLVCRAICANTPERDSL